MIYHFVGLDHVQLAAPSGCETEARKFFGKILGLPEVPKPKSLQGRGGVWFQCGAQQIHIGVQSDFSPAKKAHPAFILDNLAGLKKRLLQQGIQVIGDDLLEGIDRFFVNDPFGNRLEFLEKQKD
ncbi:VOC family protein [Risungbinella massiliensis]|uniref:glyoxalase n=1 Tax=Risungbinella massiliensis TaxID=1329796 RepID=UPI0005CB938E|nr:glyoxalase [Risungbinella massiliensis]